MPATKKKSAQKTAPKSKDYSVSASALKLVDEAAALLRKGIHTTADSSEEARREARKQAHRLFDKASESLSDLLDESASVLRIIAKKID